MVMRLHYPVLALLLLLAGCSSPPAITSKTNAPKARALTIIKPTDDFESSLLQEPINATALAQHAIDLSAQARQIDDATKAQDMRQRARLFAVAASERGSQNLMLALIIESTRVDGTLVEVVHSSNQKVNDIIAEGEKKFGRFDMDGALTAYQAALAIDPRCYRAALFSGDVFFYKHEYAEAVDWFGRAIAIDPDTETAYRYRADSLVKLRRDDEAGYDYINAFLAAPFTPIPTAAFNHWAADRQAKLTRADTSFLRGGLSFGDKKIEIQIDSKDTNVLAVSYMLARAAYVTKKKGDAKNYRHTLDEEVDALRKVIVIVSELKAKPPVDPVVLKYEAQIAQLAQLDRDGLLEALILLDRPDNDLVKDYAGYRAAHRDQLVRYIRTVWLRLPN